MDLHCFPYWPTVPVNIKCFVVILYIYYILLSALDAESRSTLVDESLITELYGEQMVQRSQNLSIARMRAHKFWNRSQSLDQTLICNFEISAHSMQSPPI